MHSDDFNIDSVVSPVGELLSDSADDPFNETITPLGNPWHEPGYEGTIDYRIRQLSYSSLLTLHACPRKFELYKKRTTFRTEESLKSTITFAFGHLVGTGIQEILMGLPLERVLFNAFINWKPELIQEDEKLKKSFWSGVFALKMFAGMRDSLLEDYELVEFRGRPACELSFRVLMPGGFNFRGHVDAVLRSRSTGKILVLECKTDGSNSLAPAKHKNSSQALGYSVVLDYIVPEASSYEVLYLVYMTKEQIFIPVRFAKMRSQRAQWLQALLTDVQIIEMYEAAGHYPQHGESCFAFMRECEYINTCNMSTNLLVRPCTEEEQDTTEYQFDITMEELIAAQMQLVGEHE